MTHIANERQGSELIGSITTELQHHTKQSHPSNGTTNNKSINSFKSYDQKNIDQVVARSSTDRPKFDGF